MTAIATRTAAARPRRSSGALSARTPPTPASGPAQVPVRSRLSRGRGGTVLFEIPFTSVLSDLDLAVLAHVLDLSTHMYPKMRPDPNSPGLARLDHFSGLFLERGVAKGQWMLEARTWGKPAPQTVHGWHVLVAQAARQLDPRVPLPERLPDPERETPDRPLGPAANKRLARFRRRIVGLP
ncbi:MAG TPA: hypothetical protein VGN29_07095 [Solirubrobacteraceae bacterium]|nr:hypothetical protein [Solirubrobacteraceae bacterium]